MSRNTKIALIVIGALVVLCAGICGISFLLLPRFANNIVSRQPADAKRVGAEIAEYTLPAGYAEVMGLNMLVYKMVVIAPENDQRDAMIFMLMATNTSDINQAQMERQMQQSFQQQFGASGSQLRVVGQESVTIRGQAVNLSVAENDASPKLRQAIGAFDGKNGLTIVMVMGAVEHWDNALLREFLSSIR